MLTLICRVFRLGKMIGVKGPGRVLIFPWMDRTKKIDVRAAAFAVPPQQFITCDGGIVEMGAEIQVLEGPLIFVSMSLIIFIYFLVWHC